MATKTSRWTVNWKVLMDYQQRLLSQQEIKANIKEHSLPATGIGNSKQVTITPESIHLFFRPEYVAEIAQTIFGIDDLSSALSQSQGLEQLLYSADEKPIRMRGNLSLDQLDLEPGVYVTAQQFVTLLPNYDLDTFKAFSMEAGIPTRTIKGCGHLTWYTLNNNSIHRLPRRDLSADEQKREIVTSDRIPTLVDTISPDILGDHGAWLLLSQGAQLFENYTTPYFRAEAAKHGIKHRKIFGKERYFITPTDLPKFQKKQLTTDDIHTVRRLANILHYDIIAGAFECSRGYIGILAHTREQEGRLQERRIHSDARLEQAIYCYFDYPTGPVRQLLYNHVFLPLAQKMGQTSTEDMETFITPFYGIHHRTRGFTKDKKEDIEQALAHIITCHTLADMLDYAQDNRELPRIVLNEEQLVERGQQWTLSNYFYLRAARHLRQCVEETLAQSITKYKEGLMLLSLPEQYYVMERYGLGNPPSQLDWTQPTQEILSHVLGLDPVEVSKLELRIMGLLRQPEFGPYIKDFAFDVWNFMQKLSREYRLPTIPRPIPVQQESLNAL